MIRYKCEGVIRCFKKVDMIRVKKMALVYQLTWVILIQRGEILQN